MKLLKALKAFDITKVSNRAVHYAFLWSIIFQKSWDPHSYKWSGNWEVNDWSFWNQEKMTKMVYIQYNVTGWLFMIILTLCIIAATFEPRLCDLNKHSVLNNTFRFKSITKIDTLVVNNSKWFIEYLTANKPRWFLYQLIALFITITNGTSTNIHIFYTMI